MLWPFLCLYFWGPAEMTGNNFKENKGVLLIFMQFWSRSHLILLDWLTHTTSTTQVPLWAKISDLIWKLFKTSEWWKVVVYLLFLLRKTTLSLEKSFKANKGQKGQWSPSKAIKGQKHKKSSNSWILNLNTCEYIIIVAKLHLNLNLTISSFML